MELSIDKQACTGCTLCVSLAPGLIRMNAGKAEMIRSRAVWSRADGEFVYRCPTRAIRVTAVDSEHRTLRLRGTIEDRSQLRRGESPAVETLVDRRRGVVHAPFLGRQRELKLAKP